MAISAFMAEGIYGKPYGIRIERSPDHCPVCHHKIDPIFIIARALFSLPVFGGKLEVEAVYQCPSQSCNHLFIARFIHLVSTGVTEGTLPTIVFTLHNLAPKTILPHFFPEEIQRTSPSFIKLFNQSSAAEEFGLTEIAGPGYGKALEFLIKDYLISQCQSDPETVTAIKGDFLGKVINNRIEDGNIKKCAERAAWLRNDETHYERRWQDKDINDLKRLITLTVNWIHNSLLTDAYSEMKK